jgi:hypothetical protein
VGGLGVEGGVPSRLWQTPSRLDDRNLAIPGNVVGLGAASSYLSQLNQDRPSLSVIGSGQTSVATMTVANRIASIREDLSLLDYMSQGIDVDANTIDVVRAAAGYNVEPAPVLVLADPSVGRQDAARRHNFATCHELAHFVLYGQHRLSARDEYTSEPRPLGRGTREPSEPSFLVTSYGGFLPVEQAEWAPIRVTVSKENVAFLISVRKRLLIFALFVKTSLTKMRAQARQGIFGALAIIAVSMSHRHRHEPADGWLTPWTPNSVLGGVQ